MSDWIQTTIGDVIALQRGFDITKATQRPGKVPVVSSGGISSFHDTAIDDGPGVVMGRKGTLGKIFFLPGPYWPHDTTLWVKDFKGSYPRFVYYFLQTINFLSMDVGSSNPTLNRNHVHPLQVRWPARPEQEAIASALGALDDKIAVNDRIAKTSSELAQAIFDASGPEIGVPINDVAVVLDGPHATPRKTTEGPWFLSISSLKSGLLDLDESAHMSEEEFPRWTRRVQPQGDDVLFSYETRLGDAALMLPGIRGSLGRRMAVLRSKTPKASGALLLHSYLSSRFNQEIRERAIHGATVDRISLTELPSWKLPLPHMNHWEKYSEVLSVIHLRAAASLMENRTLVNLRDTLLPGLMSGRVRVKDAEKVVEEAV